MGAPWGWGLRAGPSGGAFRGRCGCWSSENCPQGWQPLSFLRWAPCSIGVFWCPRLCSPGVCPRISFGRHLRAAPRARLPQAPQGEGRLPGGGLLGLCPSRRKGMAYRWGGGCRPWLQPPSPRVDPGTQPSSPHIQPHNSILPEMISQPPSLWNLLECSGLSSGDRQLAGPRWGLPVGGLANPGTPIDLGQSADGKPH